MNLSTLLAAGLLVLVSLPAQAQTLAEASEAAKKIHHDWPLSMNLGPPPAPPLTAADHAALRSTFGEIYAAGKNLDAASTTGAMPQVRDRLIAFKAALGTVADQPHPAAATGPLLAQYQDVATQFADGLRTWSISIELGMPTIHAVNQFTAASKALAAANQVYLDPAAK